MYSHRGFFVHTGKYAMLHNVYLAITVVWLFGRYGLEWNSAILLVSCRYYTPSKFTKTLKSNGAYDNDYHLLAQWCRYWYMLTTQHCWISRSLVYDSLPLSSLFPIKMLIQFLLTSLALQWITLNTHTHVLMLILFVLLTATRIGWGILQAARCNTEYNPHQVP